MTYTPTNTAMGPGDIYIADFGATEPDWDAAGVASTPGAGWTHVGGTLGGSVLTFNKDYKDLEFDQVPMPVGATKTKDLIVVKIKMAEVTLDNLVFAMNGGTLTAGSGVDTYDPDLTMATSDTDYKAIIIDGPGPNGERRRACVRKTLNTESPEIEYTKDGQQVFSLAFTSYYVSSVILPYKLAQITSGS